MPALDPASPRPPAASRLLIVAALTSGLAAFALAGCATSNLTAAPPAAPPGALATPGAGTTSTAPPGGGPSSLTPPAGRPPQSPPPTAGAGPVVGTGCPAQVRVADTDPVRTVCLARGGTVTVELQGTPGRLWRPLQLAGDALVLSSGGPTFSAVGTTTYVYVAARVGLSTLTSSRPLCPPARPGSVSCLGMQAFSLSVQVR